LKLRDTVKYVLCHVQTLNICVLQRFAHWNRVGISLLSLRALLSDLGVGRVRNLWSATAPQRLLSHK